MTKLLIVGLALSLVCSSAWAQSKAKASVSKPSTASATAAKASASAKPAAASSAVRGKAPVSAQSLTTEPPIPTQIVQPARAVPPMSAEQRARLMELRRARLAAQKNRFTGMVSIGMDMRAERDQQQSTMPRGWPTLTIGAGLKPWMALLEYASFTENSGNDALNVQRKVETLIFWGQWSTEENWALQPYLAIGLGGYRTSADLTLYSQKQSSQGRWIEHASGALGLRLTQVSPMMISVEGRAHMNRELDPSPTLSGMLKLGFILE